MKAVEEWNLSEMDKIQEQHMCCGKLGSQDYINLSKDVPASCYANKDARNPQALFMDGCISKLLTHYDTETTWIAIISWLMIAFEVGMKKALFFTIFT